MAKPKKQSPTMEEFKNLKIAEVCKKYGLSQYQYYREFHRTFRNAKIAEMKSMGVQTETIVEKVEVIKEVIHDPSLLSRVIPDLHKLREIGTDKYIEYIQSTQSKYDQELCDIRHYIELVGVDEDVEKNSELMGLMHSILRKRRAYKDVASLIFGIKNPHSLKEFKKFCNYYLSVVTRGQSMNDRSYKVKMLKDQFGETLKKQ